MAKVWLLYGEEPVKYDWYMANVTLETANVYLLNGTYTASVCFI